MRRVQKPRALKKLPRRGLYAGIGETSHEHQIYIGGDYYGDSAQIHLFDDEAERLGRWLIQAAAYLRRARLARRGGGKG